MLFCCEIVLIEFSGLCVYFFERTNDFAGRHSYLRMNEQSNT